MKRKEKIQIVIIVGVVLGTALILTFKQPSKEETERIWIARPESGSEETELVLKTEDTEHPFSLEVEAKKKSPEELETAFKLTVDCLEALLNPDKTEEIVLTESVTLPRTVEETGATVRWQSGNQEVLDRDGTLRRGGLTEPVEVSLQARITLEEEVREVWFPVTVLPYESGSAEALYYEAQEALLALEAETEEEEGFYLPEEIKGVAVGLKTEKFPLGAFLAIAAVLLPVLVLATKRQEREKEKKERERAFLDAYPRLITKLTLYVGAGMSLRGAWERIGAEYRNRSDEKKKNEVQEEVLLLVGELKNGTSEPSAYEAFGRRVGLKPYLRCTALLISQLQKGSGGLREGLETEVRLAWELHREQAEKKGEEAQTKLLFPMMGMLFLVLAIVIIPAFFSMGL